eukprot:1667334-Rhodomonas_salina.4
MTGAKTRGTRPVDETAFCLSLHPDIQHTGKKPQFLYKLYQECEGKESSAHDPLRSGMRSSLRRVFGSVSESSTRACPGPTFWQWHFHQHVSQVPPVSSLRRRSTAQQRDCQSVSSS